MTVNASTRQERLVERVGQVLQEAADRYGMPFLPSVTKVRYDLRGRVAGQALLDPSRERIEMRFNLEAFRRYPEVFLADTVPHEVAHLVAFLRFGDRGHGKIWTQVCMELGGSGERCHSMKLEPARKVKRYLYRNAAGMEVTLTSVRHNRLQRGDVIAYTGQTFGAGWIKSDYVGPTEQ